MSINPFCEIALEEAVRLKEKSIAKEVIALSIGPKACQETLRSALAIGADRAIHIETNLRTDQELQPLAVAKLFKLIALREQVDAVLLGKQAIDGDSCQTGPMTAALLGWPQCTYAASIDLSNKSVALIDRETDNGTERLSVPLPAVITADLRLNEPRYATLPNIMKAKKKPLEIIPIESLKEIDVQPHNTVIRAEDPPSRKAGSLVNSVDELIDKLKNEAKVI
eukprot:CAMPEP_0196764680 /NCGR_PEP_ID=MMETSP1095-20130614/6619_1 /TAXON_ID=96789 ORGANISM="Chromulina nebulosa, Strain UTEXLB2642" /NCGR_SAMPLE_ID=MMETSP1095 /ASSEMBLY_ACC=CAM_ASM_000446 /LENGTH=223 /DNA_ID=CAMNT_0042120825 /DNA_START=103 /DNA_END=774 /DNA_ORIENTATION=-